MKTSLELMQMFTTGRKPYYSYSPAETIKGDCFILSQKQLDWLLAVINAELKHVKNVPKNWNPTLGTQRKDENFFL